jgi:hypothetical protein
MIGKRVNIFQDLNNREIESKGYEGEATIVAVQIDQDDRAYCDVRFDGETETYPRWVMKDEVFGG